MTEDGTPCEECQAATRNQMIMAGIVGLLLGGVGFWLVRNYAK